MLGIEIKNEEIEKILNNYNYKFTHKDDNFVVTIPEMRLDLLGPRDFVEEIGRVYGYDKINPILPPVSKEVIQDNNIWIKIYLAKQKLVNEGYREVMTYVFRDKGEVEVLASASDKNYLRKTLADGLKESIVLNQKNLPLLGIDEVKVFEVGIIFINNKEEIHVAYGNKKDIIEISLDKYIENIFPEFSTNILSSIYKYYDYKDKESSVFNLWSIYPFITRDIAVWVPEGVKPEILIDIYKDFGTELLVNEPKLFDSFTKDQRTSFAYRLVFQAKDRTLTDEEINKIMSEITEKIKSLGWEVR
jgi:phenylalanyl-tRNA synthetase beta chain